MIPFWLRLAILLAAPGLAFLALLSAFFAPPTAAVACGVAGMIPGVAAVRTIQRRGDRPWRGWALAAPPAIGFLVFGGALAVLVAQDARGIFGMGTALFYVQLLTAGTVALATVAFAALSLLRTGTGVRRGEGVLGVVTFGVTIPLGLTTMACGIAVALAR